MKLKALEYGAVQKFGRHDVQGPLKVAKAHADAASKQMQAVGDQASALTTMVSAGNQAGKAVQANIDAQSNVAQDYIAMGRLRLEDMRQNSAFQAERERENKQFTQNLINVSLQAGEFVKDTVQAQVSRDLIDFKNDVNATIQALDEAPKVMTVPRDPNNPGAGTMQVSTADQMVGSYEEQVDMLREAYMSNTNFLSKNMMERELLAYAEERKLIVADMASKGQQSFDRETVQVRINQELNEGNFEVATQLANDNRSLLGEQYSTTIKAIEHDQKVIEDKAWAMNYVDGLAATDMTIEQQANDIRENVKDPVKRDEAMVELKKRFDFERAIKTENNRVMKEEADALVKEYYDVLESPDFLQNPIEVPDHPGIPPSTYQALNNKREAIINGEEIKTKRQAYKSLMDIAADPNQELTTDIVNSFSDQLDTQDYEKFMDMAGKSQIELNEDREVKSKVVTSAYVTRIYKTMHGDENVKDGKPERVRDQLKGQIEAAGQTRVDRWLQMNPGQDITDDVMQDIFRGLADDVQEYDKHGNLKLVPFEKAFKHSSDMYDEAFRGLDKLGFDVKSTHIHRAIKLYQNEADDFYEDIEKSYKNKGLPVPDEDDHEQLLSMWIWETFSNKDNPARINNIDHIQKGVR